MSYSATYDADERSPLLGEERHTDQPRSSQGAAKNHHAQFCMLIGIPSSDKSRSRNRDDPSIHANPTTLYSRATRKRKAQATTYALTAALSNTLLLSQIVLGATLTALGASESSHILITIFGVLNTVIAGAVAALKARGQPNRNRMFRDDLDHVVEEIENSETMWLGVTRGIHGYDEIDVDDKVSVRSEVARLTRLYESAVKKNAANNPDMYQAGGVLDAITGLRARPAAAGSDLQIPPVAAAGGDGAAPAAGAGATAAAAADQDEAPATAKDTGKKSNGKDKETKSTGDPPSTKADGAASTEAAAKPTEAAVKPAEAEAPKAPSDDEDPDAEPASAAHPPSKEGDANGKNGANGPE